MKRCPVCNVIYSDEGIRFCRQHGAALIDDIVSDSSETALLSDKKESVDRNTNNLPSLPSIAVLPFVSISADTDNEFFCDGLAEEILNALAKIAGLKVAARTSAFSFRGKNANVTEISRALGVSTVMEGSVRKSGNRLRITVQLVDSAGYQLWSERYDRAMEDIFDVQDEITLAIVDVLKVKLLGESKSAVLRRGTDDTEAYEYYLRGRYCWNKRTADFIKKAIDLFKLAIEKDPGYALAYVGLADCYTNLGVYAGTPASWVLPQAKAAARRAVDCDDSLAEAHASLGQVYFRQLNWDAAEKEYQRAISLNDNYATVHHWYSELFRAKRRFEDAFGEIKKAQEIDPLSHVFGSFVGLAYHNLGDDEAAIKEWTRVVEIEPVFPLPHFFLGNMYAIAHRASEAISESEKAVTLSGRGGLFLGGLGYAFAVAGHTDKALAVLRELEEKHAAGAAAGYSLAHVNTGLKDDNQALEWLEKDFETENTVLLSLFTYEPIYNQLHNNERYRELLKKMGLC